MDKKTYVESMTALATVFDKEMSKVLLDLYYDDLSSLTNEQMIDASRKWRSTGKFFPKPSELLEMANGNSKQSGGEAWEKLLKALRDASTANQRLTPEILNAAKLVGGIKHLATMDYKQLEFKRKEFIEVYEPGTIKDRLEHNNPELRALGRLME